MRWALSISGSNISRDWLPQSTAKCVFLTRSLSLASFWKLLNMSSSFWDIMLRCCRTKSLLQFPPSASTRRILHHLKSRARRQDALSKRTNMLKELRGSSRRRLRAPRTSRFEPKSWIACAACWSVLSNGLTAKMWQQRLKSKRTMRLLKETLL